MLQSRSRLYLAIAFLVSCFGAAVGDSLPSAGRWTPPDTSRSVYFFFSDSQSCPRRWLASGSKAETGFRSGGYGLRE
jgi:hypothetical protein